MEFTQLAHDRYSCRSFSEKPVEKEKLDKIIAAGLLAPTAVNKQPFRIFRMESQRAKEAIRSVTRFHFNADCFLLIGACSEEAWVRKYDDRNFSDVDASIAATHMMLEIHNQGLGSTWVGYFDAPRLKLLLPELEAYDLIAIFPIGYPAENADPSPRHAERRPASQLVLSL